MYIYNLTKDRPYIHELDRNDPDELITVEGEEYEQLMALLQNGHEVGIENGKVIAVPIKRYKQETYDQIKINSDSQDILVATDWIANKYVDVVLVRGLMTKEEFDAKYKDVLDSRQAARDSIKNIVYE